MEEMIRGYVKLANSTLEWRLTEDECALLAGCVVDLWELFQEVRARKVAAAPPFGMGEAYATPEDFDKTAII